MKELTYVSRLAVKLKQFRHIELGCLEDLGLVNVDVLERVDAPRSLFDLTTNRLGHKLLYQLLQVTARCLPGHDLEHLFPDFPNLRGLRIRCLPDLIRSALCEANSEQTKEIAVRGLHVDVSLDQRLPLANKRAQLVRREVHAMEIRQAVLALNRVDP